MSFADEVAQATKKVASAPAAAPTPVAPAAAEPPAAPAASEAPSALDFNFNLPVGEKPVDPAVKAEAKPAEVKPAENKPAEAAPAEPKKAPIKIGNREFDSIEAALEFAKEIERASAEDKAYIEGIKDAAKKAPEAPQAPVETPEEKFSKQIFEDPVKAAKEFREAIQQQIRDEYNNSVKAQAEQARLQQQRSQAWDSFFKENTDLSDPATRDLVQGYLLNKHWNEIKDLDPKKGFAKLAEISRKTLRISKEAALPTKELPNEPMATTGATGDAAATPTPVKSEENLDFVTQVNNLRKRAR